MKLQPNKYAELVKSGKISAPIYVHQAIARHESDLKRTDIYFDKNAGARVLQFFSILKHTKGKWAGEYFNPMLWQQWLLYVLFGWKNLDGTRRFTKGYFEVPRKNGKSTLMAGMGLYMFLADGEKGPEIYSGATGKKQAKIVFTEAHGMVQNNPDLKKYVDIYTHHLKVKGDSVSVFEPVSREAGNLDGLNPSCAIIDEYHAHKTSAIYDVFQSALGSRVNPLQLTITTAGFNKGAPCYQFRKTCINVLKGKKKDDSLFIMIYAADENDIEKWHTQKVWKKVNPSLGVSKSMRYMKNEFTTAKNDVGYQPNFKTKHLNIWNDGETTWIESSKWDAAAKKLNDYHLKNWQCVGGLDLASTRDITCYGLLFINGDDVFWKPYFFVPEETVSIRSKADGVAYDTWVREGWLLTTPGNVTDYNFIRKFVNMQADKYLLTSSAYDRWNSSQLVSDLISDGATFSPYAQSTAHMNLPTKEVDRKLSNGTLTHDGNPVMSWMISNVEMMTDSAGNIKPDKKKSEEKIDGVVSLVMAMGEWMTGDEEEQKESVYEKRGFRELG